jgi:hypothetical protein
MAADIFVSFASKDVRVAMTLCGALENRGFTCWISARNIEPGENFQSAIVRALRQAKIMLLVFTANSNTSEEMTKELALASQNKMIVIPLRVEDVTPNDAFAYEFATRQWIDVFADWELAIEQLSRRIGQALLDRSAGRTTEGDAAGALKKMIAAGAAAKRTDQVVEDEAPVEDGPVLEAAEPDAKPAVEAAVEALEALEALERGAAGSADMLEPAADAELPPTSDDDLWPAAGGEAEAMPEEPPRKAPVALLVGAAVALLAVIGIVVAVISHGGSKTAPAEVPTPASSAPAVASSEEAASTSSPAAAALPAASSAAPPSASDEAQSSQAAAPAAPKPVKHKKAQPKVDIPF